MPVRRLLKYLLENYENENLNNCIIWWKRRVSRWNHSVYINCCLQRTPGIIGFCGALNVIYFNPAVMIPRIALENYYYHCVNKLFFLTIIIIFVIVDCCFLFVLPYMYNCVIIQNQITVSYDTDVTNILSINENI